MDCDPGLVGDDETCSQESHLEGKQLITVSKEQVSLAHVMTEPGDFTVIKYPEP